MVRISEWKVGRKLLVLGAVGVAAAGLVAGVSLSGVALLERENADQSRLVDADLLLGRLEVEAAEAATLTRDAALADDAGRAFDQALQAHGVPARAVREQPVRWYRRKPGAA